MLERTFTEEQDSSEDTPVITKDEPEYAFEGFNIEFSEKVMLTSLAPKPSALAKEQSISYQFSLDPDRVGSFIIPDLYPDDLGENPSFDILPGMVVSGKEVVGCVVKASQSVGWGKKHEEWFKRSWKKIREVAADRYGVDFFRGCYHYLIVRQDGAKQADYFCDLVDAAGGWGEGDLMPWLDIEGSGQGSQWAQGNLETTTDAVRKQLADELTQCAKAFIKRFKERTGLRIAVYGRGLFRDLRMTDCKFGSDASVNPSYTRTMLSMEKHGVPLDDIILWQLQGTQETGKPGSNRALVPGYPTELGKWGQMDYSVYIDGSRKTTLKSLRERCLARHR